MVEESKFLTDSSIAVGISQGGRGQESDQEIQDRMWESMKKELHDAYQVRFHDKKFNPDGDDIVLFGQLQRELHPNKKSHRGLPLGPREFTLTYSTKWFDDATARDQMAKAVSKLMKYYQHEITHFRAVGEVGTNGMSHVHGFYLLNKGKKITDKNFKRAWSYWDPSIKLGRGFQGGHHQEVKDTAAFLGYIEKDIDTAWLDETFSS